MRRLSFSTVVLVPLILFLLLPAVTNIATGALPVAWQPYLWLAWPLAGLLVIPVVATEISAGRARSAAEEDDVAGGRAAEPEPARRDLPRDVPDFTGRKAELDKLLALLSGGDRESRTVAIAAIHGMAGIGKTTLAVHAAHRLAPEFPDGQLFVDLHGFAAGVPPADPNDVLDTLLRELGVPTARIPQSLAEKANLYRSRLADKRVLVLLDNVRTEKQVKPLLPGAPGCAVLITSRVQLGGIEGARQVPLDVLGGDEAAELLTKIVGRDRLASDEASLDQVADLCGRLPLAIRIAGARMVTRPRWSTAILAHRLQDQRRRLAELRVGDTSVTVAFSLSYQQLEPAARRMFRALGLQPGADLDAPTAAALADVNVDEAEDALEALIDVHLIDDPVDDRYRMHDLLRQHAYEVATTVETVEDQQRIRRRMLDQYLLRGAAAACRLDPELRPIPVPDVPMRGAGLDTYAEALHWFEVERLNLVAAVRLAAEAGLDEHVWRLAYALTPYFFLRGFTDDWTATHRLALVATRRLDDQAAEAHILLNLGVVSRRLGRYQEALDYQRAGLARYREVGDHHGEISALMNLGIVYRRLGRYREAIEHQQQALRLHGELGDQHGAAMTLTNLGIVYERLGRYAESLDHHQRAYALACQIGERHGAAMALTNIGILYERQGQFDESCDYHQRALEESRLIGDRHAEGHTMNNLGVVLTRMGRYDEALSYHEMGLALLRKTGSRGDECEAMIDMGNVVRLRGDGAAALDYHNRAYELACQIGDRYLEARALYGRGLAVGPADSAAGRRDWEAAVRIFEELAVPEAKLVRRLLDEPA